MECKGKGKYLFPKSILNIYCPAQLFFSEFSFPGSKNTKNSHTTHLFINYHTRFY